MSKSGDIKFCNLSLLLKKHKKTFKNILTNQKKECIIDKLNTARPVGQAVKTLASHAEIMGSIPVRVTMKKHTQCVCFFPLRARLCRTINCGAGNAECYPKEISEL